MNGIVVKIFNAKAFGFVRGEDNVEYFFHKDDLHGFFDDLVKDMDMGRTVKVTFDTISTAKGPRAADVIRVDGGV